MTLKEAKKRIEALEQQVKELQVRPAQQIHYHYPSVPYYYDWQYRPWQGLTWIGMGGIGSATSGTSFVTDGTGYQMTFGPES